MRKKISGKTAAYIVMVVFICLAVGWQLHLNRKSTSLRKNMGLTIGVAKELLEHRTKHQPTSMKYSYRVAGENYMVTNDVDKVLRGHELTFNGRTFPVAYDTTDPANSRILILQEDFEMFDLTYPDSLQWVPATVSTDH